MSIDNIRLPGFLCGEMYSKVLFDLNLSAIDSSKIKFASLGGNEKQILFLINNANNKFLADDEMKLLSDLLTACRISLADIALTNYHLNPAMTYMDLLNEFRFKKVLLFGVTTEQLQLPFAIPLFQIQQYQEQSYLLCPSLSEFVNNKKLKQQLWGCLQKIFLA